jgi:hypothetical protein
MRRVFALAGVFALWVFALCGSANAACATYPFVLTNNTLADANQVMADFNCAALLGAANTFTGSNNYGTPSAINLLNATGLPLTTGVTGILPIANLPAGTRTVLTVPTTFYVNKAGDNTTGLSPAHAWTSLGKMMTSVCALDLNQQAVTVSVNADTYTENLFLCTLTGWTSSFGYGQVTVDLTGSTLSAANGTIGIFGSGNSTPWVFKKGTYTGCSTACIEADSGGVIGLIAPTFATVTGDHISAFYGGSRVVIINDGAGNAETVAGGASVHHQAEAGAQIFFQPNLTETVTGTPAFTYWAQVTGSGFLNYNHATMSGGATTSSGRCQLDTGGGIIGTGGSGTYLPGSVASCTATAPAYYQ